MLPSMLENKKVYLCSPMFGRTDLDVMQNAKSARQYCADYSEKYDCEAVAPQAWLSYLLDYDDPDERALTIWFCLKLLDLCDVLFVCGPLLGTDMMLLIDHAISHDIPVVASGPMTRPVQEYLDQLRGKGGRNHAQHLSADDLS